MRAYLSCSTRIPRVALAAAGLAAAVITLSPSPIAYQDLTSYMAVRSGADQTWRRHVASLVQPNARMAGFALPRPMIRDEPTGQLVPVRFGADEPRALATPADRFAGLAVGAGTSRLVVYPRVDRRAKGDLLAERPKLRASLVGPEPDATLISADIDPFATSAFRRIAPDAPIEPVASFAHDSPLRLFETPEPAEEPGSDLAEATIPVVTPAFPTELAEGRAGIAVSGLSPIASAGAGLGAPALPIDQAPFHMTQSAEPMLGALGAGPRREGNLARTLAAPAPALDLAERPSAPTRSNHPALALELSGQRLARAERCLAEAVYWEARGESERGQQAVAQVVVNRAVSGFYPRDICGVVYQNAHRYLACQFTFACEGRRSLVPTEAAPWALAQRISREMMAGRLWLSDVGHATHYHANYVRPRWARTMNRLQTIGVHKFYRPPQWGQLPAVQVAASRPGST